MSLYEEERKMERSADSKIRKYLILILCGVAGSVIYKLPYLRETYYDAMQQALGVTNAQLGILMSAYGIVNFVLYLPGGWAADKFSARSLMAFSLISTGITGFYFATYPPFGMVVVLHAFWAITTVFTFWAACIRVIKELGDAKEQGSLFGGWYLGKGLTSMVVGFISVPIFSSFGEGIEGLRATIIFYSVLTIITGVVAWFAIPAKEPVKENEKADSGFSMKDFAIVFKMPSVWMAGLAALCMWCIYTGFSYITPYLTNVYELGESQVAIASIIRAYVLFAIGGLVGGKLADKFKTRSKFMIYAFIGMIIFTSVYLVMPGGSSMIVPALINMVALGAFIYCANAVFFSLISDADVPAKVTGTAAGLISLITYSSDIYLWTVLGNVLDQNEGVTGYNIIFTFMIVCAIVGLVTTILLHRRTVRLRAEAHN